jgi:hypothetical protein
VLTKKITQNIGISPHDIFPMFETQQSADFSAEVAERVSQFSTVARTIVHYWTLSECGILS